MNNQKTISVFKEIGTNCITIEDGQNIFKQVHPFLTKGEAVTLDFEGVSVFASPFFNAAVGQLLRDIKPEALNRLLNLAHLTDNGKVVLRRVIENSKQYYSDSVARKAIDEILNEEAEDS